MSVYHCNFTLDISNFSHVPGRGLVSVYHCNFTLDISNLSHVPGRGLVSVYHCNFTLDISNFSHFPGRGLVSVYHCNFTLDIFKPLVNFPLSPTEAADSRAWTCVSVSIFLWITNLSNFPFSWELGRGIGRVLVSVYHRNFTLDISNPQAASPGRGLVSLYQFSLVNSNPRYLTYSR